MEKCVFRLDFFFTVSVSYIETFNWPFLLMKVWQNFWSCYLLVIRYWYAGQADFVCIMMIITNSWLKPDFIMGPLSSSYYKINL